MVTDLLTFLQFKLLHSGRSPDMIGFGRMRPAYFPSDKVPCPKEIIPQSNGFHRVVSTSYSNSAAVPPPKGTREREVAFVHDGCMYV